MQKHTIIRAIFTVLFFNLLVSMYSQGGYLVIAGGGLQAGNSDVFEEIIRLGGGRSAIFGIVPAAGGSPIQSFMGFREILMQYGLNESQIKLIKIATEDDASTEEDESLWIRNAYDTGVCSDIASCTGIWFSGGDQMRVTRALLTKEGRDTPALQAIRDVLARGGIIGGTSAGAAIQSRIMIGGGSSMGALLYGISDVYSEEEVDGRGKLFLTQGLGFFPEGIVDQHFDRRARLGRLVMALFKSPIRFTLGFGIDENTALIYDVKHRTLTVKGKGGISLLDISNASLSYERERPVFRDLYLSYLTPGDSLYVETLRFIPGKNKVNTRGREYYQMKELPCTGVLSGAGFTLNDLVSVYLIDNKALDKIFQITFGAQGDGYRLDLEKEESTMGFLADMPDDEKYSFWRVKMNLIPIQVKIMDIEKK